MRIMTDGGQLARWADRGSARDFDRRYSRDSVAFWVSRLAELGPIGAGDLVLDVGCGTGGFAVGIAEHTCARVIGCDLAAGLVRYAGDRATPVDWLVADAHELPLADRSVDRVIMSLLLHRLPDPGRAVAEAHRVLRPGGSLLIKTVAPADAAATLPYRLFPTMAAAQLTRLPDLSEIMGWIAAAGFGESASRRVMRDRTLDPEHLAAAVAADMEVRYPELGADELRQGLRELRAEAARHPRMWIESRATTLVRAVAPSNLPRFAATDATRRGGRLPG